MLGWQVIQSGRLPGKLNMELDERMLQDFEAGLISPTIRIYSWKNPCISLGYSQKPPKFLNLSSCRELGWEVVKRPTGGGMVFHQPGDITYGLVASTGAPNFRKGLMNSYFAISRAIVSALRDLGIEANLGEKAGSLSSSPELFTSGSEPLTFIMGTFPPGSTASGSSPTEKECTNTRASDDGGNVAKGHMEKEDGREGPAISNPLRGNRSSEDRWKELCFARTLRYEITVKGKKLVGSAQRRTRKALLQQGTIPLTSLPTHELFPLINPSHLKDPLSAQTILRKGTSLKEASGGKISPQKFILSLIKRLREV